MNDKKQFPQRKRTRLEGYDYSSDGAYHVVICTQHRACILGTVVDDKVELSELGQLVDAELHTSLQIRREIKLDAYVIMPNHLHLIIWIEQPTGGLPSTPTPKGRSERQHKTKSTPKSLSSFVAGFKGAVTRHANYPDKIWQRGFYDRIIRSEKELNNIRQYIISNPSSWREDKLYSEN